MINRLSDINKEVNFDWLKTMSTDKLQTDLKSELFGGFSPGRASPVFFNINMSKQSFLRLVKTRVFPP